MGRIGGVVAVLAVLLQGAGAQDQLVSKVKVGEAMPAVTVALLDGGTFSLAAHRGEVVVVNFWATWCGPCKVEMPALEREVWERYRGDRGFAMVAIAREQTPKEIRAFARQHAEYSFPLAVDPDRSTYKLFADAGIPRTYVVDRKGRVVYESVGAEPGGVEAVSAAVKAALQQ